MSKLPFAVVLCLIGAPVMLAAWAQPGRAQGAAPDASAFQGGEWAELGELADGAVLSLSQARYREGSVLTFALRTAFAEGETRTTTEVIELDCAAARFRRTSAVAVKRNGEMSGSNEPGALEGYPEGSIMAQLAGLLCEGVSGE